MQNSSTWTDPKPTSATEEAIKPSKLYHGKVKERQTKKYILEVANQLTTIKIKIKKNIHFR